MRKGKAGAQPAALLLLMLALGLLSEAPARHGHWGAHALPPTPVGGSGNPPELKEAAVLKDFGSRQCQVMVKGEGLDRAFSEPWVGHEPR